jgi:hypothetical protein
MEADDDSNQPLRFLGAPLIEAQPYNQWFFQLSIENARDCSKEQSCMGFNHDGIGASPAAEPEEEGAD